MTFSFKSALEALRDLLYGIPLSAEGVKISKLSVIDLQEQVPQIINFLENVVSFACEL